MSATSEELASQAEELQTSIAFFKVDMAGGRRERAPNCKTHRPQPGLGRTAQTGQ